jgi:hypothetical protein
MSEADPSRRNLSRNVALAATVAIAEFRGRQNTDQSQYRD